MTNDKYKDNFANERHFAADVLRKKYPYLSFRWEVRETSYFIQPEKKFLRYSLNVNGCDFCFYVTEELWKDLYTMSSISPVDEFVKFCSWGINDNKELHPTFLYPNRNFDVQIYNVKEQGWHNPTILRTFSAKEARETCQKLNTSDPATMGGPFYIYELGHIQDIRRTAF